MPKSKRVVGLVGLSDLPGKDAAALINELSHLDVRAVMITGDTSATAGSVAAAVSFMVLSSPATKSATTFDRVTSQSLPQ